MRDHGVLRRVAGVALGVLGALLVVPCVYYPWAGPHSRVGFLLGEDWHVLGPPDCLPNAPCLEAGDQVLSIAGIDRETFRRDRWLTLSSLFAPRGRATMVVERGGVRRTLEVVAGSSESPPALAVLAAVAPLLFLAAGLLAALWLRPRDTLWWVLVLLFYDIALWFAAGFGQRAGGASVVFHAVIWLFAPLAIHVHLLLPEPLGAPRTRRRVLGALYLAAVFGAAADLLLVPRTPVYLAAFLLAIGGSVGILGRRLRRHPEAVTRALAWGVGFSLLPFALTYVAVPALVRAGWVDLERANDASPWLGGLSLLALPLLPASYLFALHRRRLGELEVRASRVAGAYVFGTLVVGLCGAGFAVLLRAAPGLGAGGALALVLAAAVTALGATLVRPPFQRWVDRRVFGIRHRPDEIVALVAERVPHAFDRGLLRDLLVDDVLPALLVRESALVVAGDGPEVLYARGVAPPSPAQAAAWLAGAGEAPVTAPPGSWVLLVVPLRVRHRVVGAWLLGRRDPDDRYGAAARRLLATVAHQVAPMLENVRLFEAARRSEERFRALFAATVEGIAIVRQGVVVAVNPALLALLGMTDERTILGRPLAEHLALDLERALDGAVREVSLRGSRGERVVEASVRHDALEGEAVAVVSLRDVTERRADETRRRELARQLQQAQKMEAVGRLSAGVAHDFNNCLLAIFGQVDLLRTRHAGDAALVAELEEIRAAAERASALTRRLLAFARRQPLQPRAVDLAELVNGMAPMIERVLGAGVRVVLALAPDLGAVRVDPGPFEQVLLNLAVNARDAMPGGGTLTIRTRAAVAADAAWVGDAELRPEAYAALEVVDTGEGMDAETLARVFEPFYTTKPEGTGLGLATAYGVVHQSGGRIAARSRPGEGTTFVVVLPRAGEAASPVTPAPPPAPAALAAVTARPAARTVLLVDDEPLGRRVLARLLEQDGFRVRVAGSGEEALAEAARDGDIDVLLTDVEMSGIAGTELAERLLARHPGLRVVFMTGHDDGRLAGRPALLKPFSRASLLKALE